MSEGVPPRPIIEPNVAPLDCWAQLGPETPIHKITKEINTFRESRFTNLCSWRTRQIYLTLKPELVEKVSTPQHRGRNCVITKNLQIKVRNRDRGTLVAEAAEVADTSAKRRTGLLRHTELAPGSG